VLIKNKISLFFLLAKMVKKKIEKGMNVRFVMNEKFLMKAFVAKGFVK